MEVILINIIFWGIVIYFYSKRKVSIKEIQQATTPKKLLELQKKISNRGIENFGYGKQYIEINVTSTCSWCEGKGILYINSNWDESPPYEGCPACGGKNMKPGSGIERSNALVNQKGEIYKRVKGELKRIIF